MEAVLDPGVQTPATYWAHIAVAIGISAVVWICTLWKTSTNSYRFAGGSVRCMRFGEIAWEQSLVDLV